ncbi:GH23309 [Drosophila grimshawi]|uniref:GH23309 n=1 Tax=Drosophila grimshawi TaxID=7222 RepID=B4JZZ9_DROGR|nr:GH23309 [Drosophila grimshawi]
MLQPQQLQHAQSFYLHETLNNSCYYSTQNLSAAAAAAATATAVGVSVVVERVGNISSNKSNNNIGIDSECDSLDGCVLHTLQAHELQQHVQPASVRLRHSTPLMQHRQLQQQQQQQQLRPRLDSNASAASLYQSFGTQRGNRNNNNRNNNNSNNNNNNIGNIRLSNSAESIQYATRRPNIISNPNTSSNPNSSNNNNNTRRLLINVPRQYPLRSSLRRHKEKQIGGSQSNSSNSISNEQLTSNPTTAATVAAGGATPLNKPLLLVGLLPGAEQPPSVRNSIADCGSLDYDSMDTMEHQLSVECSTSLSFKAPRL